MQREYVRSIQARLACLRSAMESVHALSRDEVTRTYAREALEADDAMRARFNAAERVRRHERAMARREEEHTANTTE